MIKHQDLYPLQLPCLNFLHYPLGPLLHWVSKTALFSLLFLDCLLVSYEITKRLSFTFAIITYVKRLMLNYACVVLIFCTFKSCQIPIFKWGDKLRFGRVNTLLKIKNFSLDVLKLLILISVISLEFFHFLQESKFILINDLLLLF